jgi:glycosyltransferase involved in cell wall biosynthesis
MKKLLIITQKVNKNDPILGFFHEWIQEFSKRVDTLSVICLEKGECHLPANVRVLSLGKENFTAKGVSKLVYLVNFYKYIIRERKNYDTVFVHMNEEYVYLGGLVWKLLGKKITMWRNHYVGTYKTACAVWLCYKVYCTSKYSFTARYKKTKIMPVGIDISLFSPSNMVETRRMNASILSLGRISSAKNIHVLIDAFSRMASSHSTLSIYGDALPRDFAYYKSLQMIVMQHKLDKKVFFFKGVPNNRTPDIYRAHEIFVNLSPSGMYDKTIFEAMACGTIVITSNKNLLGELPDMCIFRENDALDLAEKIDKMISLEEVEKEKIREVQRNYVTERHSLAKLAIMLSKEFEE